MKLRKFAKQLAAALVAGAMALSLCAPALAAAPAADTVQLQQYALSGLDDRKIIELGTVTINRGSSYRIVAVPDGSGGYTAQLIGDEGTQLYDCLPTYDGTTLTLECYAAEMGNRDFEIALKKEGTSLRITAPQVGRRLGYNVTITGAADVTIEPGNNILVGRDLNVDCTGALKITGSAECIAYGALNVYDSGSVEVNGSCDRLYLFESANITSKGAVTLENTGRDTPDAVGGKLTVDAGGAVTVRSHGAAVRRDATIKSGGAVKLDANGNGTVGAVGGKLTVTDSTSVEVCSSGSEVPVIGRYIDTGRSAEITSSGSVEVYRENIGKGAVIKGDAEISSGGHVQLRNGTAAVEGKLMIRRSGSVYLNGAAATGGADIISSGTLEVECQWAEKRAQNLTYTLAPGTSLNGYSVREGQDRWDTKDITDLEAQQGATLPSYTYIGNANYLKITPVKRDAPAADDGDAGSASGYDASAGAGGAIAAAALGGAAVWGGYEVAARVILHKLLPEGAAIPKTQAELALLLWNTAGQPEPVNAPAFANVDAATAQAAQWCTEQGYLSGAFKPEKRVAKFTVIRAWGKAFPKAT